MKNIFIIAITLLTLTAAGKAHADNYAWCPNDAVCSDTYNKRVIVYDPNGNFRQTTLMSRDVPMQQRNPNAAKYDRQAAASGDTYVINGVAYRREYFFRPVNGY